MLAILPTIAPYVMSTLVLVETSELQLCGSCRAQQQWVYYQKTVSSYAKRDRGRGRESYTESSEKPVSSVWHLNMSCNVFASYSRCERELSLLGD